MNVNEAERRPRGAVLENLAAELTFAAYHVALRHRVKDSWMELEIELWRALADTLAKQEQRVIRRVTQPAALDGDAPAAVGDRHDVTRHRPK